MRSHLRLVTDTNCPQCPERLPVTDIIIELAFVTQFADLYQDAINKQDYDMALQLVDKLLHSGNTMGQYTLHKTHL